MLFLKLFIMLSGQVITTSQAVGLHCPVTPHSGAMLSARENADLVYLGDPKVGKFYGRMFAKIPGFDKYLFCWAGRFELDSTKRGFDCITYAGTACGAGWSTAAKYADMGQGGEHLAEALKATPVVHNKVTLNKASKEHLKSFFGYVYEFKPGQPGNKGFVATATTHWVDSHLGGWTVRRLREKPPLANA